MQGKIPLVRIRNPWGNEAEWCGPWSDQSQEWQFIPPEEKREMGLTFEHDGEFWMAFKVTATLMLCFLGVEVFMVCSVKLEFIWIPCAALIRNGFYFTFEALNRSTVCAYVFLSRQFSIKQW